MKQFSHPFTKRYVIFFFLISVLSFLFSSLLHFCGFQPRAPHSCVVCCKFVLCVARNMGLLTCWEVWRKLWRQCKGLSREEERKCPCLSPLMASTPKSLQISTFADATLAPHCCAWARWSGQLVAASFEGTTWRITCLKPLTQ